MQKKTIVYFIIISCIFFIKTIEASSPAPTYAKIYIELAQKSEDNQDSSKSIKLLNLAIKNNPINPIPYYRLGKVYQKLGQEDKMLENFQKMSNFPGTDDELKYGYLELGKDYLVNGNTNKAIEYFRKTLHSDFRFGEGFYYLGLTYLKLKKYDEVQKQINNLKLWNHQTLLIDLITKSEKHFKVQ